MISDGIPNDNDRALEEGKKFAGKFNTVYCGGKLTNQDREGMKFLELFAAVTGGTSTVGEVKGGGFEKLIADDLLLLGG